MALTVKNFVIESLKTFYEKITPKFQETLISGVNIKTVANNTLLGSGNVVIDWEDLSGVPSEFPAESHNHDDRYLKLSGGTLTGILTTSGANYGTQLEVWRKSDGLVSSIGFYNGATTKTLIGQIGISGASATSMAANTPFWQVGSSTFYQLAYSTAKTQIGGATTPVYVNNAGQIVAGTALGTASTHDHADYVTVAGDSTQTITGQKNFNTATNTVPVIISRLGRTSEALSIGVDDSKVIFKHQQDELVSDFLFTGSWADMESGHDGASAGEKSIRFGLSSTDHNIYVGSSKVLHSSNYTDYTVKKDGTGASGTWSIDISGNATTATTATNLSAKPSIQAGTSDTSKVTITAGGKTSDEYIIPAATKLYSYTIAASTDLNTLKEFKYYTSSATSTCSSLTNGPDGRSNGEMWFLTLPAGSTNYGQQLYYSRASTNWQLWTRTWSSSNFSPWVQFIHSGNISSQSVASATTATYASNVGAAGTAGTNYVTAANVISMYNWYSGITATDEASNTAIDKWNEIISFLAGITDTSTLSGILAGYSASGHDHDTTYVKLSSTEQTITSTISSFTNGVINFYRSSGDHYSLIGFSNKKDGAQRNLGFVGFKSGDVGQLIYRTTSGTDNTIYHSGNLSASNVTLSTSDQTFTTIAGTAYKIKLPTASPYSYSFDDLTSHPTTLSGYGITNAVPYVGQAAGAVLNVNSCYRWTGVEITTPFRWSTNSPDMFAFTVRIYNDYKYTDIVISGYCYGTSHWHNPKAEIIGGSKTYTVKFGWHDSARSTTDTNKYLYIWIGLGKNANNEIIKLGYGGLSVFNVHTGHSTALNLYNNWSAVQKSEDDLLNVQSTQTLKLPTDWDSLINKPTSFPAATHNHDDRYYTETESDGRYLKLVGGTMTGNIAWTDSTALPEQSNPLYFVCIDAFASGGATKWTSKANTLKALTGLTSTAIGDADEPVYWNGSGFTKCGAYPTKASWNYDDVYVKLSSTEQTIESTISTFSKGIVEFYRSSGDHIAFITFSNKANNAKRVLGSIGFHSGGVGKLEYRSADAKYYDIVNGSNITTYIVGTASTTLSTSEQTLLTIKSGESGSLSSTTVKVKLPATDPYTSERKPTTHDHYATKYKDSRNEAMTPATAVAVNGVAIDFKTKANGVGAGSGAYCGVVTFDPYSDASGGYPLQMGFNSGLDATNTNELYIRTAKTATEWNSWRTVITSANISSQSVSYADSAGSAGSADSVAWDNVTNKPDSIWSAVAANATSYSVSKDTWTTTITLPTNAGSYVLTLITGTTTFTGLFSIGSSDTAKDEVALHMHGDGTLRLYAKTDGTVLKIASNDANATSRSVVIKYKRLI